MVTAIFHNVLDSSPLTALEFDRIHRALSPKSADPDRPRDVICRLHRYSQKEMILRSAWLKSQIDFDGARIAIMPDISRATLQRRAMLKPLLEKLRQRKGTYRWGFPLQLTVHKEAASFLLRQHDDLPDLFKFLDLELILDWLCELPGRDCCSFAHASWSGLRRCTPRQRREDRTPAPVDALEP